MALYELTKECRKLNWRANSLRFNNQLLVLSHYSNIYCAESFAVTLVHALENSANHFTACLLRS